MISDTLKKFIKENSLPESLPPVQSVSSEVECSLDADSFLKFLCLTMPYADIGGYDTEFFAKFAAHAAFLRRTEARCRDIPENIFLWYVLHPRVNNEELSLCRQPFYEKLARRVEGLPPTGAALEVNRWCAEHVTYRSTDERTASAMSVYRSGYGRCGEESVFAVNAYRSVGIPARQVYAPWWSHCDDNHAWVEVWITGQWRFLGGCEPEPVLDRGWFTAASSRAMIIHSKRFCRLPMERIQTLLEPGEVQNRIADDSVLYDNVTGRYAETTAVTIRIWDGGKPVPFARVSLQVLNMASFRNLIALRCDREGNAKIELGRGSIRILASDGTRQSAIFADTKESQEFILDLRRGHLEPIGSFRMRAPKESLLHATILTAGQKKSRSAVLEQAAKLRAMRKNETAVPQNLERIVRTLPQKDRDDISLDILSEHQAFMERFENDYPVDIFETYLLCPRIGYEPLSLYTQMIGAVFTEEQKNRFRTDPAAVLSWIEEHIVKISSALSFLPAKPEAVLKTGHGTAEDSLVLFAAVLKSCGIPAYVSDGQAFYYQAGAFHPADGKERSGTEILCEGFTKDMSVSRVGDLRELPVPGWDAGGRVIVPPGEYRLTFVSRLPNGDVLANSRWISCKAGKKVGIKPEFPAAAPEDMLQKLPLEPFSLLAKGKEFVSSELIKEGKRIFLWLDPAKEPTEHILNELLERSDAYKGMAERLCLIIGDSETYSDPLLVCVLRDLGIHSVYFENDAEDKAFIARRLYLEPERLPLILLMDECHFVLYAVCGYNVGTADLLLKIQEATSVFDKGRATV